MYLVGDCVKFSDSDGEHVWVVDAVTPSPLTGVSVRFLPFVPDPPEAADFVPGYYQWQPRGLVSTAALRPPIMWWEKDPNADEIKNAVPGSYERVEIVKADGAS
jgi:hypothetical protein